jgi:glycosyltransferase involved in cell wall biosynthesis
MLSATTEPDRRWPDKRGSLRVEVQKTLSVRREWRHPLQFTEQRVVHFPYDTVIRLMRVCPDVVISGELGVRTLLAALYCGLSRGCRLVIWATVSEVSELGCGGWRRFLRRKLFRLADAVIVNGRSGARYVRGFGVPANRVFFAPYTTDLRPFLALPIERSDSTRKTLLFLGSLSTRKGIVPFLSSLLCWARAHKNVQITMKIAGEGPLRAQIASLRCPLNLSLILLGHLEYERLPELYAEVGVLVFPTLADEWGLVVTEALASGVPVLGSIYSQAVEELVVDGKSGWTFSPEREGDAAFALDCVFNASAARINAMGRLARSTVERLTPAFVADKMIDAVDHAVTQYS